MQQRGRIGFGLFHRHAVGIRVLRNVNLFNGCGGEAGIGRGVPQHGNAAAGPETGTVGGRRRRILFEADFVAVIDERHARHGKEESHGHLELFRCGAAFRAHAVEVVVAGGHAHITMALDGVVLIGIKVVPGFELARSGFVKIRCGLNGVGAETAPAEEEQRGVVVLPVVAEEVQVESCLGNGLGRVEPLGNQHAFRVLRLEPGHQVLVPKLNGSRLVRVVLNQAGCHIYAEAVHAFVHPEGNDVLELPAHGHRPGSIHRLFPGMGRVRIGKAEVQGRLGVEEILDIIGAAGSVRSHEFAQERGSGAVPYGVIQRTARSGSGITIRLEGRPDIIVGITQIGPLTRLQEPFALVGGMAGHQVHHYLDAACMRLPEQFCQVGIGAETRVHPVEVNNVVTSVCPAGNIHRIQPYGRYANGLDIVQTGNDTGNIADTVAVTVLIGRRVNLVENGVLKPGGLSGKSACTNGCEPEKD